MGGPDTYQEFDNSTITSTSTTYDKISIGRFSFRKRDLLLGGIAIVALIVVVILGIVLATTSDDNSTPCASDSQKGGDMPYCTTLECLKTAVYQMPIMNQEINPCDNFYSYACGKYNSHHPETPILEDVTPHNEIFLENILSLDYLLGSGVKNDHIHSYERKVKDFISSCNNHFDKSELRGTPLVQKIIQPLGGWYVLGNFNESAFDFNQLLRRTHIGFLADPFFSLSVLTDRNNWHNRIVEFTFAGVRFNYFYYADFPFFHYYQQLYRNYISLIAHLLSIDAGVSPDAARIVTFVQDVYEIEAAIANSLVLVTPVYDNHQPDKKITLSELESHLNNTVDVVTYLKTLFNQWPGQFEANTKVAITVLNYFNQIGNLIATNMQTGEGKRKLHNYMMWQVIEPYVSDLSWNYIHAKRRITYITTGRKDSSSGYLYCFNVAEYIFPSAMNALFVKQHIKDEGKNEAANMVENIKDVLLNRLMKASWMTDDDRREAINKIRASAHKIGFPDELVDETHMDNLYYHLSISKDDFFGNILAMNREHQKKLNDFFGKQTRKTEWAYHIFDPTIAYINPWHELIVTAAMLQNPLFDSKAPSYYKYGGIGSRMASNLIHAIDEIGNTYKLDGSNYGTWWSNMTTRHYNEIKECALRKLNKTDFGTFRDVNGNATDVNTAFYFPRWAPEVLADSSGVRIAYQTFKEQERSGKNVEKLPPGLDSLNNDKMFFISYAQSFCKNAPESVKTAQTRVGQYPVMNRINTVMKNIPEFSKVFHCSEPRDDQQCLLTGK